MADIKNLFQPKIRKKLYIKSMKKHVPVNGSFELTPRCNMNCKMCYIRMSEHEMKNTGRELCAKEWLRIGRECRDNGLLFLTLTGGEPFIRADFQEIYAGLNSMGIMIGIKSNATLIDENTVAWLKNMPPTKVSVTLYGSCNETYEQLCGIPEGFTKAMHGITLLKQAGINVGMNVTFTKDNVKDLPQIYQIAKKMKLPVDPGYYLFPPMRRDGVAAEENMRLSAACVARELYRCKKECMHEIRFEAYRNSVLTGFGKDFSDECSVDGTALSRSSSMPNSDMKRERMSCIAGRCSFWMTWDGRMTPCGMMNTPVYNPMRDGFEKCWDKMITDIDDIFLPIECTACRNRNACNICGALAMAENNGDSSIKPQYLCDITKEYVRMIKNHNCE